MKHETQGQSEDLTALLRPVVGCLIYCPQAGCNIFISWSFILSVQEVCLVSEILVAKSTPCCEDMTALLKISVDLRIINVGKDFHDHLVQPSPYHQCHPLNHVPKHQTQPFLEHPQGQ